MECVKKTLAPVVVMIANYCLVTSYFVRATLSAIDAKILSESRRRIQRKFLMQLLLQAGIPLILLMIPVSAIIWTIIFDIFGWQCKIKTD